MFCNTVLSKRCFSFCIAWTTIFLDNIIQSCFIVWFRVMVLNAIFNNISVISWLPVALLVDGTAVPAENDRPVASH